MIFSSPLVYLALASAPIVSGTPWELGPATCPDEVTPKEQVHSSPPLLRNPEGLRRSLRAEVDKFSEVATDGGRASVAFLIDAEGTVRSLHIVRTSDNPVADSIAIRTARHARFYPAYLEREPVCLWVVFPFAVPPTGTTGGVSPLPNLEDSNG